MLSTSLGVFLINVNRAFRIYLDKRFLIFLLEVGESRAHSCIFFIFFLAPRFLSTPAHIKVRLVNTLPFLFMCAFV